MFLPVKGPREDGTDYLRVFTDAADLAACNVRLAEWGHAFTVFCRQVEELTNGQRWPSIPKGQVKSLYLLGASFFSRGFERRPQFPEQAAVVDIMSTYLLSHPDGAMSALPNLTLLQNDAILRRIRSDLGSSWSESSATTLRHIRRIKQLKKSRQSSLRF